MLLKKKDVISYKMSFQFIINNKFKILVIKHVRKISL